MRNDKVVINPSDEMIFEGAFNELMKKIRRNQLMYIRSREIICEWL
jgi:hypothetical protein